MNTAPFDRPKFMVNHPFFSCLQGLRAGFPPVPSEEFAAQAELLRRFISRSFLVGPNLHSE
jgi:hypothetical protein